MYTGEYMAVLSYITSVVMVSPVTILWCELLLVFPQGSLGFSPAECGNAPLHGGCGYKLEPAHVPMATYM